MSYDTMSAHDDGIEEAKEIVRAELPKNMWWYEKPQRKLLEAVRRRLLSRLERLKQNK